MSNFSRSIVLNGSIDTTEPDWYKISSKSNDLIEIEVLGYGISGDVIIGVAITLGIASDFGETLYIERYCCC